MFNIGLYDTWLDPRGLFADEVSCNGLFDETVVTVPPSSVALAGLLPSLLGSTSAGYIVTVSKAVGLTGYGALGAGNQLSVTIPAGLTGSALCNGSPQIAVSVPGSLAANASTIAGQYVAVQVPVAFSAAVAAFAAEFFVSVTVAADTLLVRGRPRDVARLGFPGILPGAHPGIASIARIPGASSVTRTLGIAGLTPAYTVVFITPDVGVE